MGLRKILMGLVTVLMAGAVFAGMVNALGSDTPGPVSVLENVRDYAPAIEFGGQSYAVDGGQLYVGEPGNWHLVAIPNQAIASAVAVSPQDAQTVYLGLANRLAIYRSTDSGATWYEIPLETTAVGSVTDIAVDEANRLVYVGTDTDGVHRLRDVGSSMIAAGHLLLDEPVEEVVTESSGNAMAFVRTRWHLYRAEEMGLRWIEVDGLPSPATAIAIAPGQTPTIYVGTASSGVRVSNDGVIWRAANIGLNLTPGSQLMVHDLTVDPLQPQVLYVSTSVSFGSTVLHTTPVGVAMTTDGAQAWQGLASVENVAVTEIVPVAGQTGSAYGLTEASRALLALGDAPSYEMATAAATEVSSQSGIDLLAVLAWVLAGLAAIGFLAILWLDITRRRQIEMAENGTLLPKPIKNQK